MNSKKLSNRQSFMDRPDILLNINLKFRVNFLGFLVLHFHADIILNYVQYFNVSLSHCTSVCDGHTPNADGQKEENDANVPKGP